MDTSISAIFAALGSGLPVLLAHLATAVVLLALGVVAYQRLTPYDEMELARQDNAAGGLSFGGSVVALAIPLAATLATSQAAIDIVLWGVIAIILQLVAFLAASKLIPDLSRRITEGISENPGH